MQRPRPIPTRLGRAFSTRDAAAAGVGRGQLRHPQYERPFRGVRVRPRTDTPSHDPYVRQADARLTAARAWLPRMLDPQFFSHETAATIWGGPLPLSDESAGPGFPVHVSILGDGPLPREPQVSGHRARPQTTTIVRRDGVAASSPASTWASLGHLPLDDLVALGDYFCRVWREGIGRQHVGRTPLATRDELRSALNAGRRVGNPRLREAIELVREDSWSPRESQVRCILGRAGLPEPELNLDVFDDRQDFVACLDLAYPRQKVGVEYHGVHHATTYAADIERLARLRAAGWNVIEVSAALLARPRILVDRVRTALRG